MTFEKGHKSYNRKKKPPLALSKKKDLRQFTLKIGNEAITVDETVFGDEDQEITFDDSPATSDFSSSKDDGNGLTLDFDSAEEGEEPALNTNEDKDLTSQGEEVDKDTGLVKYQMNQDPASAKSILDIDPSIDDINSLVHYIKILKRHKNLEPVNPPDGDPLTSVYDPTAVLDATKIQTDIYTEALFMRAAFEYYYALGSTRNIEKVAQHFGVGQSTALGWSSRFKWSEKLKLRIDRAINDPAMHTHTQSNRVKKAVLDIISNEIVKKLKIDKDGKMHVSGMEIRNVKDMREAMDLYRELRGEIMYGGKNGGNGARAGGDQSQGVKVQLIIKGR